MMAGRVTMLALLAMLVAGAVAQNRRSNAPSWRWIKGEEHEITVGGDSGWTIKGYDDIGGLTVGDSIIFNWVGSHTVTLMRRKSCDFQRSSELAATDAITPTFLGFNPPVDTSFKFTFTEPGTYHFADGVDKNCQQGMLFSCFVS